MKTFNNIYDLTHDVRSNVKSYINTDFGKTKKLDMLFMLHNFKNKKYVKTETGDVNINFVTWNVEKELDISIVPLHKEWLDEGTLLFVPILRTVNDQWNNLTVLDWRDPNVKLTFSDNILHNVLELEEL